MLGLLTSLFSSGVVGSVEKIASEFIETDLESAEAKALMCKVLDPNGKMRRDLSRFACIAYGFYLIAMVFLSLTIAYDWGDATGSAVAVAMMQDLFLPITAAWSAIVGASFGTNVSNNWKDTKLGNKNG